MRSAGGRPSTERVRMHSQGLGLTGTNLKKLSAVPGEVQRTPGRCQAASVSTSCLVHDIARQSRLRWSACKSEMNLP